MCSGASATHELLLEKRGAAGPGQTECTSKHMPDHPDASTPCLLEEYPPRQTPGGTIIGGR